LTPHDRIKKLVAFSTASDFAHAGVPASLIRVV